MNDYAILTNRGGYTIFRYGNQTIRFATSEKLEKYTKVKEWDKGYIVVMAKYRNLEEMEEYIDLIPILERLYYDVDEFLEPIKEVKIDDAVERRISSPPLQMHRAISGGMGDAYFSRG